MASRKIFVVLGTKAQLIKMAPIMVELQKRKINYDFIFTGQHKETMRELVGGFQLKKPDCILYKGGDVTKIRQMIFWFIKCIVHTLKNKKKIFGKNGNAVLVHGDAISALLGVTMAKISGLKIAYIEAGLRSFDTFNPFPEEITRRLVSNLSDYHFCPGDFAYKNSQKYGGIKINTKANTLLDSLRWASKNDNSIQVDIPREKYCLVSIHRFGNIFNKAQLSFILEILEEISRQVKVLLILHKPTKEKLKEYGFFQGLRKNPNIELRQRYDYFKFIKLLCASEFVITDGGSNQEECWYLGKPCLVMRKTTERKEGLDKNVVVSKYDKRIINNFVDSYQKYKFSPSNFNVKPSKIIVDYLEGLEV